MTTKAKSNVKKEEELPECFIIMPISDPEGYDNGHFKHVYENIIKPACKLADYKAYRADDNDSTNMIHDVILKKVLNAPMAICDLSSLNPNVMFELGIRQAFDKPVVLIQEKGTKRVFDLAPIKTIEYPKGMVYHEVIAFQEKLKRTIVSTFEESSQPDNSNSIVKFLALQSAAQLPDISGNESNLAINSLHSEIGSLRKLVEQSVNNQADNLPNIQLLNEEALRSKDNVLIRLEKLMEDTLIHKEMYSGELYDKPDYMTSLISMKRMVRMESKNITNLKQQSEQKKILKFVDNEMINLEGTSEKI